MKSLNVLILEEHLVFGEALRRWLEDRAGICAVGNVANFGEAMRVARGQKIDMVVLDLVLPWRHGIAMISALKALQPTMKILVFSARGEVSIVVGALAAGADGFLAKRSIFDELVCAIQCITDGGRYICPNIAHDLAMRGIRSDTGRLRPRPTRSFTFS